VAGPEPEETSRGESLAHERVVFFSDAVFAIALTLLVVEIGVPEATGAELGEELVGLLPAFGSYALSFAVTALFWLGHRRTFTHIDRIDDRVLALNMLLLFVVAFLPFPSALMGEHGDEPAAAAFYGAWLALLGGCSALLWWYATAGGLVGPRLDRRLRRYFLVRPAVVSLCGLVSVPVALASPYAAWGLWLLAFPLQQVGRGVLWHANRHPDTVGG
jgi:TMEM175 potassium channel family protein